VRRYVVVQAVLFVLVALGPRHAGEAAVWPWPATMGGLLLMVVGAGLLLAALLKLGRNLTPLPFPKDGGTLVQTGAYRFVRHPIYSGGLTLAFAWALCVHGVLTLVYAAALFVLFDVKSRREERWLVEKFPEYRDYQRRVRRLIPFLY
jgi:protein-S-isoprenylcysteine O-methyltransferase Ste14